MVLYHAFQTRKKSEDCPKITFSQLVTLTIELDLDMVKADLHVKFLVCMSNGSIVRAHTGRHRHGSDSPADAGGNKKVKIKIAPVDKR